MSILNEEDLIEIMNFHGSSLSNNLGKYSEDDDNHKHKTIDDVVYMKCRKCVKNRSRISCLQNEEVDQKTCFLLRPSSSSMFLPKFWILLALLMFFFVSSGSASAINMSSTYSTTTPESRGRWCQLILNEEKTKEVTETRMCSEKYNSSCGFFSYETCTYTRYKICTRVYNHTYVAYRTVMDCCPGWAKKDNDTCIELPKQSNPLPSIHELSVGTFAAMCSASAFVMVIVFFIVKAVWKKKRKEKAAAESVHMEQLDSLDAAPQPQQEVPLIPPQPPRMANPHGLHRSSYTPAEPDLLAAAACAPVTASPHGFTPAHSYSFGESDALCPKADRDPDVETDAVNPGSNVPTTMPLDDHQEQVGMKLLQKIPEPEDTGSTETPADITTPELESTKNLVLPDPSNSVLPDPSNSVLPDPSNSVLLDPGKLGIPDTSIPDPTITQKPEHSDNTALEVELFIREDGEDTDDTKPESLSQLKTQILPESSINSSQGSQSEPKV